MLLSPPQVVRERLVCRTIVDGHSSYEQVHSVDVTCTFMSSLLSMSPEKMDFCLEKVGQTAALAAQSPSDTSALSAPSLLSRGWARTSSPAMRSCSCTTCLLSPCPWS